MSDEKELNIEEEMKYELNFEQNAYAHFSTLATEIRMEEEEFLKMMDEIDMEELWDAYYAKLRENLTEEDLAEYIVALAKLHEIAQEASLVIPERMDQYLAKQEGQVIH